MHLPRLFYPCIRQAGVTIPFSYPLMFARNQGQRDKLADAHERFSRLNGRKLDPLPSKELQELGDSLKWALGHIERIVNLQNKR